MISPLHLRPDHPLKNSNYQFFFLMQNSYIHKELVMYLITLAHSGDVLHIDTIETLTSSHESIPIASTSSALL